MSKGWEGGSTRAWRKYRARILDRDGHTCRLALPGCRTAATTVHHLDGVKAGKTPADTTRCIAACEPCNWKTGDPTQATPPPNPPTTRWD